MEAQLAQQAGAENQVPVLSLSKKLLSAAKGTKSSTRGCLHSCCNFKGRRRSRYSRRLNSGAEGASERDTGEGGAGAGTGAGTGGRSSQVELKDIAEPSGPRAGQPAGQGYRVAPGGSLRQRLTDGGGGLRETTTNADNERPQPSSAPGGRQQQTQQQQAGHEQAGPSTSKGLS